MRTVARSGRRRWYVVPASRSQAGGRGGWRATAAGGRAAHQQGVSSLQWARGTTHYALLGCGRRCCGLFNLLFLVGGVVAARCSLPPPRHSLLARHDHDHHGCRRPPWYYCSRQSWCSQCWLLVHGATSRGGRAGAGSRGGRGRGARATSGEEEAANSAQPHHQDKPQRRRPQPRSA